MPSLIEQIADVDRQIKLLNSFECDADERKRINNKLDWLKRERERLFHALASRHMACHAWTSKQAGSINTLLVIAMFICACITCALVTRAFEAPALYVAPSGTVCGCMIEQHMHYDADTCSKIDLNKLHEVIRVRSCK